MNPRTQDHLRSYLIADCDTNVTSVALIERQESGHRLVARAEAATTAEPPYNDVSLGLLNAVHQLEESTGRQFTRDGRIVTRNLFADADIDEFLCTSSVGGGLQMMVAGLVRIMTAESAKRAALGAGATVMDVFAIDDGLLPHSRIQRIREQRPDIFLLSGGIDGGNMAEVLRLAEHIVAAKQDRIPVIYAGNKDAREKVVAMLSPVADVHVVDNIRPVLEEEVLEPSGHKIHDLFMDYVVKLVPGYEKIANWSTRPVLPSAGAVGDIIDLVARDSGKTILGVNVGSETTDVFSVFQDRFTRTISGDVGLGSSVFNVYLKAGHANVLRWLPAAPNVSELRNHLRNKMLHSATIPHTLDDLVLEHALAREVLRLAFDDHEKSVVGLRGIRRQNDIADMFNQTSPGASMADLMKLDLIIASGLVFRRSPYPIQALMILLDGIMPQGVTQIALDHSNVACHLGALANVDAYAAAQVYRHDCLTYLGTAIAPVGEGKAGMPCITVEIQEPAGGKTVQSVSYGDLVQIDCGEGEVELLLRPSPPFDVGGGPGKAIATKAIGGKCGLIVDTRDRKLLWANGSQNGGKSAGHWYGRINVYPGLKGV